MAVDLASRLICQTGGSVLCHPRSAALKAVACHTVWCKGEEFLLGSVILAFQDSEKGCFECAKCTPKLLLNAAIEMEGFRVKS